MMQDSMRASTAFEDALFCIIGGDASRTGIYMLYGFYDVTVPSIFYGPFCCVVAAACMNRARDAGALYILVDFVRRIMHIRDELK